MRSCIYIFLFFSINIFAFEPICTSPRSFRKNEIKNIFTKEENNSTNQLIIYSVNPPTPIDWSSPGKAFKSIFKNSFINEGYEVEDHDNEGNKIIRKQNIKTHFIGHMFMKITCEGFPEILTGMTSSGKEEISGLMIDGKSFQQILSPTKGHFNSSKELSEEIEIRKSKVGNLNYMGINLTKSSCQELLGYFTEFHACGVSSKYGGLNANPHKAEGAGCSAFAISFLQRLGIVKGIEALEANDFGHQFMREINIPKIMLFQNDKEPEIGAWRLLKGHKIAWASDDTTGRKVKFFDPELFSAWVQNYSPDKNISGLQYLGRDGNKLINGIWFQEQFSNASKSNLNINYLFE